MIKNLPRPTPQELVNKMNPYKDEELTKAFEAGFKKAWLYKEQERKGWEASAKLWRIKYEKILNIG